MVESYPVHYSVQYPSHFSRRELALRIVAFIALGLLGLSFGALFLFAYLVLPVVAATRLATARDPGAYVEKDGPFILSALRWLAAGSAWAGLIADRLPAHSPDETVRLWIEGTPHPTPSAAAWRVLAGLPAAFVVAVLGWIGVFVWLWAAVSVLVGERVGRAAFGYLVGLQRYCLRLLVYQASLVDEYPPFSFVQTPSDSDMSPHPAA